jgi:hypothetical protein
VGHAVGIAQAADDLAGLRRVGAGLLDVSVDLGERRLVRYAISPASSCATWAVIPIRNSPVGPAGICGRSQNTTGTLGLKQTHQKVGVTRQAIELSHDQGRTGQLAVLQGLREGRPIGTLPGFLLLILGEELMNAAIEVAIHGLALRFEAEALPFGADP